MLKEVMGVTDVYLIRVRTMAVKYPMEVLVVEVVMFISEQVLDCKICMSFVELISKVTPENLVRVRKITVLMRKTFVLLSH